MTEKLESENSVNGYDLCVSCGKQTKYLINVPIHIRYGYVEGAGQLCDDCDSKTFGLEARVGKIK